MANKGKPEKAISKYTGEYYRQHNPYFDDGKDGFIKKVKEVVKLCPNLKIIFHRIFADGDYVFLHCDIQGSSSIGDQMATFDHKATFDIFRLDKNGKIVEHWDAQQIPPVETANGHTMFDGLTDATDKDKTEINKELVKSFIEKIMIDGDFEHFAGFFDGDKCIQHSPYIADGASAWQNDLVKMEGHNKPIKCIKLHKILGEGNFVFSQTEVDLDGNTTVKMDLFRIE
jgi:predicted SnoaL-like aldol condensation-catalyzing enzyme